MWHLKRDWVGVSEIRINSVEVKVKGRSHFKQFWFHRSLVDEGLSEIVSKRPKSEKVCRSFILAVAFEKAVSSKKRK